MLQFGVQRGEALLLSLGQGQQFGAQVHQKAHAALGLGKALQQPRARRHQRAAQVHLGLAALGIAGRRVIALARGHQGFGIGAELLDDQCPEILACGQLGLGVPVHEQLRMAAALDVAQAGVGGSLQVLHELAQLARGQHFLAAPQGGLQALGRAARRRTLGCLALGLCCRSRRIGAAKAGHIAGNPVGSQTHSEVPPCQAVTGLSCRHRANDNLLLLTL